MTIANGYCTLAELKHQNRLNINDSDSTSDDMLEGIIEAVSRQIDDECDRHFYSDSADVARYFTAVNSTELFVDDIASVDSDVTIEIDNNGDGTFDFTFAQSDFVLSPYNAEVLSIPYQKVETSYSGQYLFPVKVRKGVKITAKWGWKGGVPKPIKEACLLQSERLFKRFSTPLGSESMTALGRMTLSIPSLDPDVINLINRSPYKRIRFG